jgi:hypothetical protein
MLLPMESERLLIALTPFGYVLERPVIVSAKRLSPRVLDPAPNGRANSLNGFSILPAFGDLGRVERAAGARG